MNTPSRLIRKTLALTLLLGSAVAPAQDWPQWRGVARDGKVTGFTAPKEWPKELTQKWKVVVGDGVATPALVGDKLYVFSRQDGSEVLRCIEVASGKELWQDKYEAQGAGGPAASYSGPRSSPVVSDGKVVTLGVRGMLSCLDAATGKKLWRKDDFQGSVPRFNTSSSPVVANGLVIAQLGGQNNGALVAYDLATGAEKWKWSGDSPAYASPSLMTLGDLKLVIAMTERNIVAVNLSTGKQVWETAFASGGPGAYNASTPVVDGQTLVYSGGGRGTFAVQLEKDGDAVRGKQLWKTNTAVQFNTPVIKDGVLYGLSQSNELFAIDMKTGDVTWTAAVAAADGGGGGRGGPGGGRGGPGGGRGGPGGRMGGGGGRGGYGTVVDAGSALIALTPAGQLIVFAPGAKYTEQAKIKVATGGTQAYPILSGNRIIVKDQDSVVLYTID